jgi:uncharacterized membrane protein
MPGEITRRTARPERPVSTRALEGGAASASPGTHPIDFGPPVLLGFALGGFFDGILLHQILQWHHLLSVVKGEPFGDIAVQILADGLFHAAMYVVAAVGLWRLYSAVKRAGRPPLAVPLVGALAIGFGVWHVVDTFVSHWWLGIHRIRMAPPGPLFWDVLWLVVFGLLPLLAGLWIMRGHARGTRGRTISPVVLLLIVGGAGAVASLPPRDGAPVLALYAPDTPPEQVMDGITAAGGGLVWFDARAGLWAIDLPEGRSTRPLRTHGAWLVSRSAVAVGCFSWLRRAPGGA